MIDPNLTVTPSVTKPSTLVGFASTRTTSYDVLHHLVKFVSDMNLEWYDLHRIVFVFGVLSTNDYCIDFTSESVTFRKAFKGSFLRMEYTASADHPSTKHAWYIGYMAGLRLRYLTANSAEILGYLNERMNNLCSMPAGGWQEDFDTLLLNEWDSWMNHTPESVVKAAKALMPE